MLKRKHIKYPDALKRSDIVLGPLLDHIENVLLIGNGDIQAILKRTHEHIIMNLSKNDIWDRRMDTSKDSELITTQELMEEIAICGNVTDGNLDINECYRKEFAEKVANLEHSYQDHPYPSSLLCASVCITAKLSNGECNRLSLEEGTVYCHVNTASLRIFADANANVYIIEGIPDDMNIELTPIEQLEMNTAVVGKTDYISWIKQNLPPDLDIPEMHYIVMLYRDYKNKMAYVTIAISRDAQVCYDEAYSALVAYKSKSFNEIHLAHKEWWSNYWSASGISLQDSFLEAAWYRELYFFACGARCGKTAPALFIGMADEYPMWHGDYHFNINMEMGYWGCYAANHDELSEPYDSFVIANLNRSIWLAKKLFEVDGAYYNLTAFLDEPQEPELCKSKNGRQYICHVWSRTLGISAFAAQNLWWHYTYTQDSQLLKRIYPVIREVSMFYVNWGKLYPTVSPEHWGITPNLQYNKNCTFDICLIKFIVNAAIKASILLNTDKENRQRWIDFIAVMPAYPVSEGENPVVVDVEGAPPIQYNIPVPIFPVFPGEDFEVYSDMRQLFIRTLDSMEYDFYDPIILSMVRLRLNMDDAFDYLRLLMKRSFRPNGSMGILPEFHRYNRLSGYATQGCGMLLPLTELLLQSHNGVIRLFPAWNRELNAEFDALRAVGAFIVSSSLNGNVVSETTIKSLAGGQIRLKSEWENAIITDNRRNVVKYYNEVDGIIVFDTEKDGTYMIREKI